MLHTVCKHHLTELLCSSVLQTETVVTTTVLHSIISHPTFWPKAMVEPESSEFTCFRPWNPPVRRMRLPPNSAKFGARLRLSFLMIAPSDSLMVTLLRELRYPAALKVPSVSLPNM